jgi:hypothetical protein
MGWKKEEGSVKPKSVSATSLQVAELCLARYEEEYINYARGIQGNAANVGIVCHGAFEDFLRAVYIKKTHGWDEEYFWTCFHKHSDDVLGPDRSSDLYLDARDLCEKWFNRSSTKEELDAVKILSLESKNNFLLKTTQGDIPVNYIMDRFEQIGENEYRVVDYKSNRVPLTSNQLRRKLQARLYALMTQIKYPKAEKIWVRFEFLRHGSVETLFTRDDNVVMYRELQRRVEGILEAPSGMYRGKETLNSECGYCVRKSSCKTLISHVNAGGVLGKTPDELVEVYAALAAQQKAQGILKEEIETALLEDAVQNDLLEFETKDGSLVTVQAKMRRSVDNDLAALAMGNLAGQFQKFSVTDVDKILKQKLLPPGQAELLKQAIKKNISEPTIKIDTAGY